MRRKYLKSDLARDLQIDRALITRYARRGMPTHSLAAAQEWRRTHLDPLSMKATRPAAPAAAPGAQWDEEAGRIALDLIRHFAENAERDFAGWAEPLREAMRQLPARYWDDVELAEALWTRLIGEPALAVLQETDDNLTAEQRAAPVIPATAAEALFLDTWPYMMACGLARVQGPPALDEHGDA